MKKILFFLFLFSQATCLSPAQAQVFTPEAGNIKIGVLQIHPSLSLEGSYSDNIYQNYGGLSPVSGYINTVSPAVKLKLPVAAHLFTAEARGDVFLYSVDSESNYVRRQAGAGAKFNFARGLDLAFSYDYTASEIPRRARSGEETSGEEDYFRARPFQQNGAKGVLGFTFADRWRAEGSYDYMNYRYNNQIDSFGNVDRAQAGGKLFYRFTTRISALGEYQYRTSAFPEAPEFENKTHFAFLGLSFDPAAKLSGELKAGYESKRYDQKREGAKDSFNNLALDVNLTQRFTQFTSLKLLLNRTIREDLDSNAPYQENKGVLEFRYIWPRNERISAALRGAYSTLIMEGATLDVDGLMKVRDDRRWEFGARFGYDLGRWLTLALGYQYLSNTSNFTNYDYQEHRIFINLLASF
ncbi:MAG: outer membrane beta-barrel protein [Thermodesulfobacteriota bacterium]